MNDISRTGLAILAVACLASPTRAAARDPLATFETAPTQRSSQEPEYGSMPSGGERPRGDAVKEPARFVMQLGADFGQTEAATLYMTDGSEKTLKYNQGVSLAFGASVPFARDWLAAQATLGFEYSAVNASNVTLAWTAFPLEALVVANLYPLRIGAGVSYLVAPTVRVSGDASEEVRFENSLGLLFEADLFFRSGSPEGRTAWWLGVRYELQDVRSDEYDYSDSANAVGLVVGLGL